MNDSEYLERLCEFVAIPSVSTDPAHRADMDRACQWLCNWATGQGLLVEVWPTPGHPSVYIETPAVTGKPVLLIYGHYDVQPAEDIELWTDPPFQPTVREDRLYGRGSSDNKGQIWTHCAAIQTLLASGPLPCQIKILVEGEEEVGSPNLPALLEERRERLGADLVLVSDTSTAVKGVPTLHYSLRGIVIFEVHLKTAGRDVHSGVFGGTSPNATHRLAQLISRLHDDQGRVVIPGFYDRVRAADERELALLAQVPFDPKVYQDFIGCTELVGEAGYSTNERRWFRPTLDCNGLGGGFQGEGSKTIVPARAWAKFSARLVADQRPEEVLECCRQWFLEQSWAGEIDFRADHGGPPYLLDPYGPMAGYLDKARQALRQAWDQEPLLVRHGGAIPIVSQFQTILGLSTLLMGFGSPDDAIHSPNEKFELANFRRGMHTSRLFLSSL
jgi:acetylornithine deacetylase/succinyl-diaminopimelate desuccinylase-like protein